MINCFSSVFTVLFLFIDFNSYIGEQVKPDNLYLSIEVYFIALREIYKKLGPSMNHIFF